MAKPRRRRAGRPRKAVDKREPNGRPQRGPDRNIIPAEVLAHRAAFAPKATEAALRGEGAPLKLLRLRGGITSTQMDAGERMGKAWRRWSAAASAPPRWPVVSEASAWASELTEEQWQRYKREMDGVFDTIGRCQQSKLVLSMLETVCVEEVMPPHL